jgi:hypothetical protein
MPKYSQVSEVTGIVGASAVDSALLSCILWEGSHSLVRSRMPGGATSLGGLAAIPVTEILMGCPRHGFHVHVLRACHMPSLRSTAAYIQR